MDALLAKNTVTFGRKSTIFKLNLQDEGEFPANFFIDNLIIQDKSFPFPFLYGNRYTHSPIRAMGQNERISS